jgi:transcription initiation factor TFIID subunit 1
LYVLQERLKQPLEAKHSGSGGDGTGEGDQKNNIAPWRFGPAQYWFDLMDVDDTGENFDYGFRLKSVC